MISESDSDDEEMIVFDNSPIKQQQLPGQGGAGGEGESPKTRVINKGLGGGAAGGAGLKKASGGKNPRIMSASAAATKA